MISVLLDEEYAADATKHCPFVVVRLAVQAGAAAVATIVNHLIVQIAHLNADRQAVVGILGIIGVLCRDEYQVFRDGQCSAVLRARFESDG